MAEEFQESEIMFQLETNTHVGNGNVIPSIFNSTEFRNDNAKANKRKNMASRNTTSSVPVKIPEAEHWLKYVDMEVSGEDYTELVPPHMIIRHRVDGNMNPFSVCSGNGRTLKGRDLSQVRNTILRMTGFLES